MKNKRKKWIQHVIAFVLVIAMLLPMSSPVSVQAAELYLAYQEDENGTAVTKLKSSQREKYRVSTIYMENGQKLDLCFINAFLWKDARWTSSNPEVATVDGSGIITAKSAGMTEITLTYTRKVVGTKISASTKVYVGEENWDVWFGSMSDEEKDGFYEVKVGTDMELCFNGISKLDNPDIYSMSLESSDPEIASISGVTLSAKKAGIVTVTLNIKNKVTGNVIKKRVKVKCYITIQDRMDYLLKRLGVTEGKVIYFTKNHKACANERLSLHGCSSCNVSDIVEKETWVTDIFGKGIRTKNFPSHTVDADSRDNAGQSCFGFACFAQWYVYADSISESLKGTCIATIKFNKNELMEIVQPGDVVRVNGHSILVYELDDEGVWVIDSNWNAGNQLNCVVQKHLIPYTNTFCAGHTAYVNRVTKAIENGNKLAGVFDGGEAMPEEKNEVVTTPTPTPSRSEKTQYGYYHYTDGKGDYAVCAHYGQETSNWKNIYREEIWVDEPLKLERSTATSLKHPEVSGCKTAGCLEGDFWDAGGRYIDENGVLWYREQTRMVDKDVTEAQKKTVIKEVQSIAVSDSITLAAGTRYSFKNVSSGWHMNVKSAGKSNGTQINLWPLDMSEPNTQCYTITVVSTEEKSVMISPVCAPDMYIDVRRGGKPLTPAQLISLWEADGDTTKEIVIEMLEDGSCYLTFKDNRDYCIGAKSETAAETKQTQLVVCKKTGAAEQRWYLCDENGTVLGKKQEASQNTSEKDVVLQAKMEELVEELLRANRIALKNEDVKEPYFTTTAKAVANPSADECKNEYVVNSDWFKAVFFEDISDDEYISTDIFPKHWGQKAEGNNGYSCHGFACFAQWYLYKEKNTDKIISKGRVAEGTYTEKFLRENLQVGDVIRVKISGDLYHSMIFHSFTDIGIKVLDCNFGKTNMVRIDEVKYTQWKKTSPVYIYRVQE